MKRVNLYNSLAVTQILLLHIGFEKNWNIMISLLPTWILSGLAILMWSVFLISALVKICKILKEVSPGNEATLRTTKIERKLELTQ